MMALGYMLKRRGMTSDEFLKTLDKLVYYIFFPVMLFWKTAKSTGTDASGTGLLLAALGTVFLAFPILLFLHTHNKNAGQGGWIVFPGIDPIQHLYRHGHRPYRSR